MIECCRSANIPVFEKNFSLVDVYDADEAFVTGTFAGLIPVSKVDGRAIGTDQKWEMINHLRELYHRLIDESVKKGRV